MKKLLFAISALAVFCVAMALYARASVEAQHAQYLSDLRVGEATGIAMMNYASSHAGRLPKSQHWEESIKPYWPDKDYTVSIQEHPGDRLAMNSKLSGVRINSIPSPDRTIVFFETHSNSKDVSGVPSWKQCYQCGSSTKGRLILVLASGWASSYAEGAEISFSHKK